MLRTRIRVVGQHPYRHRCDVALVDHRRGRIRKTEALTASLVFNAYLVTSMSDLDDTFGQWLTEARTVGDGMHVSREASGRSAS